VVLVNGVAEVPKARRTKRCSGLAIASCGADNPTAVICYG
jgi:hypothetical protein